MSNEAARLGVVDPDTPLRAALSAIELTLLVGSYAVHFYLPHMRRRSMTEIVGEWRAFLPEYFVLPHPSWRTVGWLRGNPRFEEEALPELRDRVRRVLGPEGLNRRPRSAPCPRR